MEILKEIPIPFIRQRFHYILLLIQSQVDLSRLDLFCLFELVFGNYPVFSLDEIDHVWVVLSDEQVEVGPILLSQVLHVKKCEI